MKAGIFVLLLLITSMAYAVASCPASGDCPDCKQLENALQAKVFVFVDNINYTAKATFFYENISTSPPRQPINFTAVIIEISNDSFRETYRIYTDEKGIAAYNFSEYKNASINMRFLYCPFMNPIEGEGGHSKCGFIQCLEYGGIKCVISPSCLPDAIPERLGPGQTTPSPVRYYNLLPVIQTVSYNPPPKPLSSVPAICLPALMIFALLGGALFLSGRNPFAGFDFSAPRIGRHIRYQARTVSAGVSAPTPFVEAVRGSVQGLVRKGIEGATSATAGIGKKGAAKKAAKAIVVGAQKKLSGEGGGGTAVAGPGGQMRYVAGGGRGGFKSLLKAGFVGTTKSTPWDKYQRAFQSIKSLGSGLGQEKAAYLAGRAMEKGSSLSFSTLSNIFFSMGNFDKAVASLKESGGSKFSFDVKGVQEVKDTAGNVVGLQALDSKGNPLLFSVGGKKAEIMLDASALREGKISGNVVAGDRNFTLKEGEIISVSEQGKRLEGKAFDVAIKSFDMKDFSMQLAKSGIRMETRMHSEQFNGPVTVEYNPFSVGTTGDFIVTRPGKGGDAEGVVSVFKSGKLDSVTDLSGTKPMQLDSIPGTEIKKGDSIGILRQAYNAHESYSNILEAKRDFDSAKLAAAGEAFAARNPGIMKDLERITDVDSKINSLGMRTQTSDYAKNAPHFGIEANATKDAEIAATISAQQALSQNKDFQKAQKQYEAATSEAPGKLQKMSQEDARKKYMDPVIEKHREAYEAAYMATYTGAYKSSLAGSYVQYAEQQAGGRQNLDKNVRAELKERAYDIASQFMDKGTALQSRRDLFGAMEGVSFNELREPDPNNPDRTILNTETVNRIIGQQIADAASNYKKTRGNPGKYSARELAYAAITLDSPHLKYSPTSAAINTGTISKSSPTKDFETLVQNIDNLPKKKQDELFYKATYNLHQAAEEARSGGASGTAEDDRKLEAASVREAERRERKKKEDESLERIKKKRPPPV